MTQIVLVCGIGSGHGSYDITGGILDVFGGMGSAHGSYDIIGGIFDVFGGIHSAYGSYGIAGGIFDVFGGVGAGYGSWTYIICNYCAIYGPFGVGYCDNGNNYKM